MDVQIRITSGSITIGQLLKKIGVIDTGGQSKSFLLSNKVLINDKAPVGRSSKVHSGDIVWINDKMFQIIE